MIVKFKKVRANAVAPKQAYGNPAGADLTAAFVKYEPESDTYKIYSGIAIEPVRKGSNFGIVTWLLPNSRNRFARLTNSVGTIDEDFRGEIFARYQYRDVTPWYRRLWNKIIRKSRLDCSPFKVGDVMGQLVVCPYYKCKYEEATELSSTERGTKGDGSSSK